MSCLELYSCLFDKEIFDIVTELSDSYKKVDTLGFAIGILAIIGRIIIFIAAISVTNSNFSIAAFITTVVEIGIIVFLMYFVSALCECFRDIHYIRLQGEKNLSEHKKED